MSAPSGALASAAAREVTLRTARASYQLSVGSHERDTRASSHRAKREIDGQGRNVHPPPRAPRTGQHQPLFRPNFALIARPNIQVIEIGSENQFARICVWRVIPQIRAPSGRAWCQGLSRPRPPKLPNGTLQKSAPCPVYFSEDFLLICPPIEGCRKRSLFGPALCPATKPATPNIDTAQETPRTARRARRGNAANSIPPREK